MIKIEKNEHIIAEIRKHWLVFSTEVLILIILAFLPLLFVSIVSNVDFVIDTGIFDVELISLFIFFYSLWLLVLWITGSVFWTNYYLDVWIVTDKQIIDVEQHGLFKREVSFLHMDKIQDVTYKMEGIIPTLLNYGDISVQTAGVEGEFPITGVPNPAYVQDKISEALHLYKMDVGKN
jgi:uncharacterized membrane protein YdbT with pleckstrin-like domain